MANTNRYPFIYRLRWAFLLALLALGLTVAATWAATNLQVTKSYALVVDSDSDAKVDPGDVIQYTVTVRNTGADTASDLVFTDTVDNRFTLDSSSLNVSPLAQDDSYPAVGNTLLVVGGPDSATEPHAYLAATSLLTNDIDFLGDTSLAITAADGTSQEGGQVSVNLADGSFTYRPKAGYTGSDSFTYTLTDSGGLTGTAKVNLAVTSRVWYVDSAVTGGDGRSNAPLQALSNVIVPGKADQPGDMIYLFSGTYNGSLTLLNNQQLIGNGVALQAGGFTLRSSGTRPTVSHTANIITLGDANSISGLALAPSSGSAITGSGKQGPFQVNQVYFQPSGSAGALDLTGISVGFTVTNSPVTANSSGTALMMRYGSSPVSFSASPFTLTGGKAVDISGWTGTVSFDATSSILLNNGVGTGISLNTSTQPIIFSGPLSLTTTGTGINVFSSKFAATHGDNQVTATNGPAISLDTVTLSANTLFSSLTSTNSTTTGIRLNAVEGADFTANGGQISNATGNAFTDVSGKSKILFAGAIRNTLSSHTVSLVDIRLRSVGDISLTGEITSSAGPGISVTEISGSGNITFSSPKIELISGTSTGINLVNTVKSNHTVTITGINNTITTTTGKALNVVRTTIGAGGLNFLKISANGAVNGISLNDTGLLGGLTVTGDGSNLRNSSGGVITNTSGNGIDLRSTNKISLSQMNVSGVKESSGTCDTLDNSGCAAGIFLSSIDTISLNSMSVSNNLVSGINGSTIAGFNLTNSEIKSNGTDSNEDGIDLREMKGASINVIENNWIENNYERNLYIRNTSGTIKLDLRNNDIVSSNTDPAVAYPAVDGVLVTLDDTASSDNLNLTGNRISGHITGMEVNVNGMGTGDALVHDNTFTHNLYSLKLGLGGAATGWLNFDVKGNAITSYATSVNLVNNSNLVSGPGTLYGYVRNNTITNYASGSDPVANSIWLVSTESGDNFVQVLDNIITDYAARGIALEAWRGSDLEAHVSGNNVSSARASTISGLDVRRDRTPVASAKICLDLTPANHIRAAVSASSDYVIYQPSSVPSIYQIEGLLVSPITGATISTYLQSLDAAARTLVSAGSYTTGTCTEMNDDFAQAARFDGPVLVYVPADALQTGAAYASLAAARTQPAPLVLADARIETPLRANLALETGTAFRPVRALAAPPAAQIITPARWRAPGLASLVPLTRLRNLLSANTEINIPLGNLPAGKDLTIVFNASVDKPFATGNTQVSNQGKVTGTNLLPSSVLTDDPDTVLANDPTLTLVQAAPIFTLEKRVDAGLDGVAQPGETINYTLEFQNTGNQHATGVTLTEPLPANTTLDAAASPGWTCLSGVCTYPAADSDVRAGSEEKMVAFIVKVNSTVPFGAEQISNTATMGDSSGHTVDSLELTLPLEAKPIFTLTKTDNDTDYNYLDTDPIRYALTYRNTGNQNAQNVTLREIVPARTTFNLAGSTSGWTCADNALAGTVCTFPVGDLVAGGSSAPPVLFAVNGPTSGPDPVSNTAGIDDDTNEGEWVSASDTTPLRNQSPVFDTAAIMPDPANLQEGETVIITAEFHDPDNTALDLLVDWGDGTTQTYSYLAGTTLSTIAFGPVSHTYSDDNLSDQYLIRLTLDDGELSAIKTFTATVTNVAPVLLLASPSTMTIGENGLVTVSGSISDVSPLDVLTLTVNWGEGLAQAVTITNGAFSASHTYLDDNPTGTNQDLYSAVFTLSDDDNGTDSETVTVTVNNTTPVLTISTLAYTVDENGSVTVSGTVSDTGTQDNLSLTVNWGEGLAQPVTITNGDFSASHTYLDDNPTGTSQDGYSAVFTLSDDDGGTTSKTVAVTVDNLNPVLTISTLAYTVDENGSVTVNGSASDIGTQDELDLTVDWGEGISQTITINPGKTFSASHTYLDDNPTGTSQDGYSAVFTLSDDDGGTASETVAVTVYNLNPVLTIPTLAYTIDENGSVTVNGTVSDTGTQDSLILTVDWGEGSPLPVTITAGAFSATHTYLDDKLTAADLYSAVFTLTDDDGGINTKTAAVTVKNVAPVLTIPTLDTTINENGEIEVSGSVSDAGTQDSLTLMVNWGEGVDQNVPIVSGAFNARHTYQDDSPTATANDDYPILFTLSDNDGGTDSKTGRVTVNNTAPLITSASAMDAIVGANSSLNLQFEDAGLNDTFAIHIDWGDGQVENKAAGPGYARYDLNYAHGYANNGSYTITVTVTDDDLGSHSQSTFVNVSAQVDLVLLKTASVSEALSDTQFDYTFTVTNHGPSIAAGVTVTDTLPAELAYVSGDPVCAAAGNAITCDIGDMAASATAQATITVKVLTHRAAPLVNTAAVQSVTAESNQSNNSASTTVLLKQAIVVRDDDFDNGKVPVEWGQCANGTSITPGNRQQFLGEFSNETVCLALDSLPQHDQLKISFDLYIIRSWDGNLTSRTQLSPALQALIADTAIGPDRWKLTADKAEIINTTFSNWIDPRFTQAFPGNYPGGSFPSRTGAAESSTLGYLFGAFEHDTVYHITRVIDHQAASLLLEFSANGLQSIGDESWGLDNVKVETLTRQSFRYLYLPVMHR